MASLTIWLFADEHTDDVLDTVRTLKERSLIEYFDAGLVRWPAGASRPELRMLPDLAGERCFGQPFWTRLFGMVFFPATFGSGGSTVGESVANADLGLTPELARTLREEVRSGTAALFVYSSGELAATGVGAEEIRSTLKGVPTRLLRSNLSAEQHERLLGVFGTEGGAR